MTKPMSDRERRLTNQLREKQKVIENLKRERDALRNKLWKLGEEA